MIRSYRYRLTPTKAQAIVLFSWLRLTREIYNAALQERRDAHVKQKVNISRYDQQKQIKDVRAVREDVAIVPVTVIRGAIHRLDKAFTAFFRRCKAGEKPGYPRFKSASRWNTLEFDNPLNGSPVVAGGKRVKVPLLGKVRLTYHRPIEGCPRTMSITSNGDGHWYVSIACDGVSEKLLPATGKTVGVDLGITHFAVTSDGDLYDNLRPLATARLETERAQRRVARRKRGSKRRKWAVRMLRKKHQHIVNIRREHNISVAKSLVDSYGTIVIEKLDVKEMVKGKFAKSINDAAWGNFKRWLNCKAEEAGRTVVEVNPRFTSQTCSRCGYIDAASRNGKFFCCVNCGFNGDADVNAAVNIKGLGTSLRGTASAVGERCRSAKCMKTTYEGLSSA